MENPSLLLVKPEPEAVPSRNRGWFGPGDPRINRRGRPTRIGAMARQAKVGQPLSGRLVRLFLPGTDLCRFLCNWKARSYPNLPDPRFFHIVAAEMIPARGGIMLTLASEMFAPVESGAPIPELVAGGR